MSNFRSHESVLDCIGHTPMVRLNRVFAGHPADVYAKLFFFTQPAANRTPTPVKLTGRGGGRGP